MFGSPVNKQQFDQLKVTAKNYFFACKNRNGQIAPCQAYIVGKTKTHTAFHLCGIEKPVKMANDDYGKTWCIWDGFF